MADAPILGGSGKLKLDADVFGAPFNGPLVHECVVAELAARRQGTHATKTRGMVRGGGAKPWRQKGTGRARQCSIRAPQFAGGGVVFGPSPRRYTFKVNRKERRAAFRSALSAHAAEGTLGVLDGSFDAPSTKQAVALLAGWGKDTPVLVVATEDEEALIKSFRNVDRVAVTVPSELEVRDLVWARALLVTSAALEHVEGRARS